MEGVSEESGCPRQYRKKYVEESIRETDNYALAYGTMIHDVMYLVEEEGLPPLPDALEKAWARLETTLGPEAYQEAVMDLTTYMDRTEDGYACIAVEQELTAPLMVIDGKQYYFGGRLDWIGIDPDHPARLIVKDYKTNRVPPRQQMLDKDNQFTHYIALAKANSHLYLPGVDPDDVEVIGIMDAIKWRQVTTFRENWQIEMYLDWLRAMTRRIVQDQEGLPVLNDDCSWCSIKNDCPEFKSLPGVGQTLADRMSTTTDLAARVVLMHQAESAVKNLKPMIEDVKAELKALALHQGPQTYGGKVYDVADDFVNDWDIQQLAKELGVDVWNVVSVTAYKVEEVLKRKPELRLAVEACRQRYPKQTRKLTSHPAEP